MKKYLIVVAVVLIIAAGIAVYNGKLNNEADANQRTTKSYQSTTNPAIELFVPNTTQPAQPTAQNSGGTDSAGDSSPVLSQEEAAADYNYMWQVLEDNYAFFGVAKRKYGVDKDEVKQKYLDEIMQYSSISAYDLGRKIISECLLEFHFCGNLGIPAGTVLSSSDGTIRTVTPGLNGSNVLFKTINDTTAYMKINSMDIQYSGTDYEQIINFYSQIKDYQNLIIDITGNSGGDINYWIDNIVKPNIDTKTEYSEYFFVKPGRENLDCMTIYGFNLNKLAVSSDVITDMKSVNTDDLKMFDKLYKNTVEISPEKIGEKQFNGNIYLLIDKDVTGEADNFAAFCKNTGFATVVGTMWGSSGKRGDIYNNWITLPNSRLIFEYSPVYMLNADGSCNEEYGTPPEYICKDGETPLDACLRVIAGK